VLEGEGGLCGADGNGFFQVSSVSGGDACVSGWCRGWGGRVECDKENEEKVRMGREGAERRRAEKKIKNRKKKKTMKEKKEKRCREDRGRDGLLPV
jgi:hypothetical protein